MGGHSQFGLLYDVWSSPDGINWTQVTDTSGAGTIGFNDLFVLQKKLWLVGTGAGNQTYDSVWTSDDGITWRKVYNGVISFK